MCIVCQAVSVGAAALTGILPVALPEAETLRPVPPAASLSATQPASIGGIACKKLGQIRKTSAGSFRCTNVGSRRVWRRSPAATETTTVATTTTTIPRLVNDPRITPSASLSYANQCRMADLTNWMGQETSSGFPRNVWRPLTVGKVRVLLLPIVLTDLPFTDSDLNRARQNSDLIRDYFRSVSYGKADVEIAIPEREDWVQLNGSTADYRLFGSHGTDQTAFMNEVFSRSSPALKLSTYAVVVVQSGWDRRGYFAQGFPLSDATAFRTPSGIVRSAALVGGWNAYGWNVVAHELGHSWLGYEDLYHFTDSASKPFGRWDLMNDASGPGKELTVWHRFLAGWVNDSQIRCIPQNSPRTVHFLSALPIRNDLPKGATYLLSAGRMLVIESRRPGGFDSAGSTALVYVVDTNIPHSQAPFRLVGELTSIGQRVSVSGVDVDLLDADESGDLISISFGSG